MRSILLARMTMAKIRKNRVFDNRGTIISGLYRWSSTRSMTRVLNYMYMYVYINLATCTCM